MVAHEYSRILGKTMKFGKTHHLIRELQWLKHEINDSLANGGEIEKQTLPGTTSQNTKMRKNGEIGYFN